LLQRAGRSGGIGCLNRAAAAELGGLARLGSTTIYKGDVKRSARVVEWLLGCDMACDVVDLFCGLGGFSEGAKRAGCRVVLGLDNCQAFLDAHALNHTDARHELLDLPASISQLLPRFTRRWHLHGSPSCKDRSQATRAATCGTRDQSAADSRELWYLDQVLELRPDSWSLEQSPNERTEAILRAFEHDHPGVCAHVTLPLCFFGVPQNRTRLIAGSPHVIRRLTASRDAQAARVIDVIPNPPTEWLMSSNTNTPIRASKVGQDDDGEGRKSKRYRPLTWREKRRSIHGPAYTVLASGSMWWIDDEGNKVERLSVNHAALLQTLGSQYKLSETRAREAVGNAVPPEVGRRMMSRWKAQRCQR
jgi:site-specific DNA-cytosine methylase